MGNSRKRDWYHWPKFRASPRWGPFFGTLRSETLGQHRLSGLEQDYLLCLTGDSFHPSSFAAILYSANQSRLSLIQTASINTGIY